MFPPSRPRSAEVPPSWPARVRLKKRTDFLQVQGRGKRIRLRCMVVLYQRGSSGNNRFGITVSRKVGGAVTRNRVKRWLREALRHEVASGRPAGGPWDFVFIASPSAATAGLDALRVEVRSALSRFEDASSAL